MTELVWHNPSNRRGMMRMFFAVRVGHTVEARLNGVIF